MIRTLRSLAAVMVCAGAAASVASAQCSLYRWNVPDFDQKRSGLPGNGGMYCVPTSAVNWMAYISNNGWPLMMNGPRDWQSQANFNFVTSTDDFMGDLMGTTPANGTYGNPGLDGLRTYMFLRAPYMFTASVWYGSITPLNMHTQIGTNGLVSVCYGYYKPFPNPFGGSFYTRNGGHCVTLSATVNVCSDAILRLRNPADDDVLNTQSPFTTVGTHAVMQTFDSTPTPGGNKTLARLTDFGVDSSTRRYIDTMYVIRANFNCWAPATTHGQIKLTKTLSLFGDQQDQEVTFNLPTGVLANAIAVHPDQTKAVYVSCVRTGILKSYAMHLLDLSDGSTQDLGLLLPAVGDKTPIAFDRFGHLITCDGSVLKQFDVSGRAPVLMNSRTLAQPASSLVFDDVNDEVVVLTPGNRRLIRLDEELAPISDEPLPTGVPAMGDGSVVPDPATGRYIIAVSGDPHLFEISVIPGTPRYQLNASLLLPAVQSVEDIQPADGGGFYAMCDGSVKVMDRDPTAGRLRLSPNQVFGNLPSMRCMNISRSRTNYDPALHSGPAWRNIENPDEGVVSTPDCVADFNLDGIASVQDIFDFLAAWFAGDAHADVNASASLSVQDIFDFLAAWFAGCR